SPPADQHRDEAGDRAGELGEVGDARFDSTATVTCALVRWRKPNPAQAVQWALLTAGPRSGQDTWLDSGERWAACRPRMRVLRPEVKRSSRSSAQAWVPCAVRVGKLLAGREQRNACTCCLAALSPRRCSAGEEGPARAKPRV